MGHVLLPIDPQAPDPSSIRLAADALGRGELVIFPTETVYGLAAHPDCDGALDNLYRVKGRDPAKPVTYLLSHAATMERFGVKTDGPVMRLVEAFWPGPLTLVLPAGAEELGFRVPDHPVAMALLEACGGVLCVTSANRSGRPPACTSDEAEEALGDRVGLVLDGGRTPGGIPSTVAQVVGGRINILRAGAISEERLRAVI